MYERHSRQNRSSNFAWINWRQCCGDSDSVIQFVQNNGEDKLLKSELFVSDCSGEGAVCALQHQFNNFVNLWGFVDDDNTFVANIVLAVHMDN